MLSEVQILPTTSEMTFSASITESHSVTDMRYMFAGCYALTTVDVSGFDTSKVMDMGGMFYNCTALAALDVSGFDTLKVMDMSGMFCNCTALTTVIVDPDHFDLEKVAKKYKHISFQRLVSAI